MSAPASYLAAKPIVIAHVQTRMLTGGAEENTWASCEHQAAQGHVVHLICGRDSRVDHFREANPKVHVHLVPEMVREIDLRADMRGYRQLVTLLREIRPDLVHTHTSKAGILGRLAARAAGVPAVLHGVHMLPFSNVGLVEKGVYLLAEHAVAPITDRFVHVSHGTLLAYRSARVGPARRHGVVRSGMDVARFRGALPPEDRDGLLGVAPGEVRPRAILMLAALEARKRHAEFIDGFMDELAGRDDVRLLLAGDGPEAEALRQRIAERGIGRHVRLLGHRPDPHRLVAMADVCVLASMREGLPRVIVQALAGGRPAVVSPFRGIEEIVEHGVNGLIVRDKSAQNVAREAVRLVRDRERLARFTAAAASSPVEEWTFPAMFAQLDQTYRKALQDPAVIARFDRAARPSPSVQGEATWR